MSLFICENKKSKQPKHRCFIPPPKSNRLRKSCEEKIESIETHPKCEVTKRTAPKKEETFDKLLKSDKYIDGEKVYSEFAAYAAEHNIPFEEAKGCLNNLIQLVEQHNQAIVKKLEESDDENQSGIYTPEKEEVGSAEGFTITRPEKSPTTAEKEEFSPQSDAEE